MCKTIMAILLKERTESAVNVQEMLTKHGCNIKTRLGLHDSVGDSCTNEGLIILQLCGPDEQIEKLQGELNSLENVKAEKIVMSF